MTLTTRKPLADWRYDRSLATHHNIARRDRASRAYACMTLTDGRDIRRVSPNGVRPWVFVRGAITLTLHCILCEAHDER
jgi:hypothetical protein